MRMKRRKRELQTETPDRLRRVHIIRKYFESYTNSSNANTIITLVIVERHKDESMVP